MPATTKNTGMKKPYPMASSLASKACASPGFQCRSTTPARKAPSTTSSPNSPARTRRPMSRRIDHRRVVWPVVSAPSATRFAQPAAAQHPGGRGEREADHGDGHDRDDGGEVAVDAQEDRDGQDREELAGGARRQEVAAEGAAEHALLAQDGQHRAEGTRRQGQGDRHEGVHVADGGQAADHAAGDDQRHAPGHHGQLARAREQHPGIDLETGEQEHEAEADVRDQLQLLRGVDAEPVGADEHPAEEEQDDLRDALVRDQGGQERGQCGHQGDDEQLLETGQQVHGDPTASAETEAVGTGRHLDVSDRVRSRPSGVPRGGRRPWPPASRGPARCRGRGCRRARGSSSPSPGRA